MDIRKKKQQFRERRKKLIIEGEEEEVKEESISMVMVKHLSYDPPSGKFRTISSDKKSKAEHSFQISSLPKKIKFN